MKPQLIIHADMHGQHPHGFGLLPSLETIPEEIRNGHWCVWKAMPRATNPGKFDKIPFNGQTAISTAAPEQWLTFEQAIWHYHQNPSMFNGVGRLCELDGLTFIDIDNMDNVETYLSAFPTYWELSPSGHGIRGVSLGNVKRDVSKPVEIYSGHAPRFVTITGRRLGDSPLADLSASLDAWIETTIGDVPKPVTARPAPAVNDAVKLPFSLSHRGYERVPADVDRSSYLMSLANKLLFKGMTTTDVFSFLVKSEWLQVALEHRRNDHDKALEYLWHTVLKAEMWVEAESPQGDNVESLFRSVAEGSNYGVKVPSMSLMTDFTGDPPAFNREHWPTLLADYAEEISHNSGMDPLAPAFAGLWSICAAIDNRSSVKVPWDWVEPIIVWVCIIGDPSTMKTPATKPFITMLGKVEDEYRAAHQAQMAAYEQALARYEAQQRDNEDIDEEVTPPPPRPIALRLVINEATGQGLRDALLPRPRGVGVFYDEMSDFLSRMMATNREHPDRSFWNKAYNGGRHTTQLASRGELQLENLAAPFLGNVQPDVLRPLGRNLRTDGLIQRFIPVPLRDAVLPEYGKEIPEFMSRCREWESLLRRLVQTGEFELTLCEQAKRVLHESRGSILDLLISRRVLQMSTGHNTALGKINGLTVRIAGLFHLIEGTGTEISMSTFSKAFRLITEYVGRSQGYLYNVLFGFGQDTWLRWLHDQVLCHGELEITLRDIKRAGKRREELMNVPDAVRNQVIRDGMAALEDHNILAIKQENAHSTVWAVNPEYVAAHQDVVEDRRAHRQVVVDSISGGYER